MQNNANNTKQNIEENIFIYLDTSNWAKELNYFKEKIIIYKH